MVDVFKSCTRVVLEEVVDVVDVDDVEVGVAILVVIGGVQASAHQGARQSVLFRHVHERPVSLVHVEFVGGGVAATKSIPSGQVEVSVVVKVEPNGCVGEALVGDPRLRTHFHEGHVAFVPVKQVGGKLGPHVDVFVAVVVVIAHRHRVVLPLSGEPRLHGDVHKLGGCLSPKPMNGGQQRH